MESDTCTGFMGLKDDFGHSFGHLYAESNNSNLSAIVPWTILRKPTMDKINSRKDDLDKDSSEESCSTSGDSEESTNSDNEELSGRLMAESCQVPKPHRQLCRSPCIEPYIIKRNEILQDLKIEDDLKAAKDIKKLPDMSKEYQTKLDFALKLGYSEEQVLLVLSKLGTNALINDILGELVKLGSKSESEQNGSVSTNVREPSSFESQRSESPFHQEAIDDSDNLRPIVIDGSNVAMR